MRGQPKLIPVQLGWPNRTDHEIAHPVSTTCIIFNRSVFLQKKVLNNLLVEIDHHLPWALLACCCACSAIRFSRFFSSYGWFGKT
jgi:hypothetical protein